MKYKSASKGEIEISEMNDTHLDHALGKFIKEAKSAHRKQIVSSGSWRTLLDPVAHELEKERISRGLEGMI